MKRKLLILGIVAASLSVPAPVVAGTYDYGYRGKPGTDWRWWCPIPKFMPNRFLAVCDGLY